MGKNYTIYIRHEQFETEGNKSGLVNELLDKHYDKGSLKGRRDVLNTLEHKSSPTIKVDTHGEPIASVFPACCLKKNPRCKHWEYNDLEAVWINTNTGEKYEVL